jgi:hypothetical protein
MAVTFDAITSVAAGYGASGSGTHTPVSGPSLALVGVITDVASQPTSVTYGGQAMTYVDGRSQGSNAVYIYKLKRPPSGAQTVTVNFSGSKNYRILAETFLGADDVRASTNGYAAVGGAGTDFQQGVTSLLDDLVTDYVAGYNAGGRTEDGGQTLRYEYAGGNMFCYSSTKPGAAGSTTIGHTFGYTGSNQWYWGVAASISPLVNLGIPVACTPYMMI